MMSKLLSVLYCRHRKSYIWGILAIVVTISISFACMATTDEKTSSLSGPEIDGVPAELSIIWEAWQLLEQEHLNKDKLDAAKLSRLAVTGMLEGLEDRYASYLSPQDRHRQQEDFRGSFEGIGAQVTMREGKVVIVAPIADSPAERANIRSGDMILQVDGESIEGYTLLEVVNKIRGPKGSVVTLLIQRTRIRERGDSQPFSVTIVRDSIALHTVTSEVLPEKVILLTLRNFNANVDEDLADEIRGLDRMEGGVNGIILDLRDNLGGLLDTAVNVANLFIESGLILYEINGDGVRRDWTASKSGINVDIPMVILVNKFSASASEVVAGALQDHNRAVLIGEKTFGKGNVNTLRQLSDGSGIYFSIARWYTPKGTMIEGHGVIPDILVSESIDDTSDPFLARAIQFLNGQESQSQ